MTRATNQNDRQRTLRVIVLHSPMISNQLLGETVDDLDLQEPLSRIPALEIHKIDFLNDPGNFNTIVLVLQHEDDKDLWRNVVNNAKSRDPYVELILVVMKGSVDAMDALRGGYYAYFEPPYAAPVLRGYIYAANERINRRKERARTSAELNEHGYKVKDAAETILLQLKNLVDYDQATITLLSEREYIWDTNNRIHKSVRTLLHHTGYTDVNWWLLRPIKDDRLIQDILEGKLKQYVFTDTSVLKAYGWDVVTAPDVASWIVLPLRYLNKIIGIITLDKTDTNSTKRFTYADVNEVTVQQFANQAALTIVSAQQAEAAKSLKKALTAVAEQTDQDDILMTIAEQARQLVDGLYSYVVLSDANETQLEFKSASPEDVLDPLRREVGAFPIPETEASIQPTQGITALAYIRRTPVIIDDCQERFKPPSHVADQQPPMRLLSEYDKTATRAYKPFNHNGIGNTNSDIAIPIIDMPLDAEKTLSPHLKPRVLGVINIEHRNPCAFTETQIETLQEFARFAAIAIKTHNAKVRLERLFKASNDVMDDMTQPMEMLSRLANETERVALADGGVKVFVCVDNKVVLRGHSTSAVIALPTQQTRPNGHTVRMIGLARKNGRANLKPIVIPNVSAYDPADFPDYPGIQINKVTLDANHKALLCLPMWLGDKIIGAMWMHYKTPQQFSEEELREFQLYANRAAAAHHNEIERKLLEISEELGQSTKTPALIGQKIVNYLKERFNTLGVVFYIDEPRRKQLRLYASTIDESGSDQGQNHMPVGKIIRYGEGLAGHHYLARNQDGIQYSQEMLPIPDYASLPKSHQIQADADLKKLKSLYSIRLQAPLTGKKIGILILNDEIGRTYNASEADLLRFANLVANLLVLIKFQKRSQVLRYLTIFMICLGIAILVAISQLTPLIYQDQQRDIESRNIAFGFSVLAGFFLILVGGVSGLEASREE